MNRGATADESKLNRHRQRSFGTLKIKDEYKYDCEYEYEYEYDSGTFLLR